MHAVSVTLNATIINPLTNSLYTDHNVRVQFFDFFSNGTKSPVGIPVDSTGGVALRALVYPTDGNAHAYNATIINCTDGYKTVSNVVSSPVQLTVGQPDKLVSTAIINLTSTTRDIDYYFSDNGNILFLGGRQVDVKINDTEFTCTTDPTLGTVVFTHDFPAINGNLTTYVITASFAGDNPVSASANSTALDGSTYSVCSTAQYNGYKPSSNSIVLTVDPQSILATTLTKTPEEMQKEAEDGHVLRIWPEFSWWFPWFKMVGEVTLSLLSGTVVYRSELVPLAFSQTTTVASGTDSLIQELKTAFRKVGVEAVVGYIVSMVSAKLVAWVFGSSSLVGLAITIGVYATVTLAMTYVLNSAFGRDGLLVSVIAFFMSLSIDLLIGWAKGETGFLYSFVRAIYVGASTGSVTSMWHSWWGSSMNFFNIVSTAAFYLVDLGLGAGLASSL